jgi:hypothetical protein
MDGFGSAAAMAAKSSQLPIQGIKLEPPTSLITVRRVRCKPWKSRLAADSNDFSFAQS